MFKNFSDSTAKQEASQRGGKATQVVVSRDYKDLGGEEAAENRINELVAEYGLVERHDIVENAPASADGEPSMLGDWQTPKGVKPSRGITAYRTKAVFRGISL